jgi:hypothetical protein
LRTTTQIFGTVASLIAVIILAPCRMMPCFSTAVPTMNPGTSERNSSGTLNASHSCTKRVALSAESTNSTPPLCSELFATTPMTSPFRRAKPTVTSRAHSAWISKYEPSSTRPLTKRRMSKAIRSLAGTSAARSTAGASWGTLAGGVPCQLSGR